jgi:hypothetical protein
MKTISLRPASLAFSMLLILALSALAGCIPPGSSDADFVVADLFTAPGKALATLSLSPTPAPDETVVPDGAPTIQPTLPLPTAVILQQPTAPLGAFQPTPTRPGAGGGTGGGVTSGGTCSITPTDPFLPVWQNVQGVRSAMGCPLGDAFTANVVWQNYENGFMFWRAVERDIFVVSEAAIRGGQSSDSWWRFNDTWQEGVDPEREGLEAPAGLSEPVRGFGKVWRTNGIIRDGVGWAREGEFQTGILWQAFEGGILFTGPGNAPVYVLVPADSPPYSSGSHTGPLP